MRQCESFASPMRYFVAPQSKIHLMTHSLAVRIVSAGVTFTPELAHGSTAIDNENDEYNDEQHCGNDCQAQRQTAV